MCVCVCTYEVRDIPSVKFNNAYYTGSFEG